MKEPIQKTMLRKKKENGFHSQAIEPKKLLSKSFSKKVKLIFKPFSKISGRFTTIKMNKQLILPLILLLITIMISSNVLALGIAPSSTDMVFSPNSKQSVELAILNNDNKDITVVIYAEGELAEYISISEPLIDISSSQQKVKTSYKVSMPSKIDKQGLHETNIVIREISKTTGGETAVGASLAIISKLKLFVPYTGKYAEIKLMAPHFELNKESNFAVEVHNLGTEKILKGYVVVDIYGPLNNKIKTLTSKEFSLDSKQKTVVVVPWTPDISSGEYVAEATLVYDEKETKEKKAFTLGELSVSIESISIENFRLGGIAKFDILIANNWNTPIPNVYAATTVTDDKGTEYLQFKTAALDVPAFGREKLEAYWDTSKVLPGPYKLDIVLNYLEKTSRKLFDIKVEQNRILVSAAAVAPVVQTTIMRIVYILIILVGALIVINVLMLLRNKKKGFLFLSFCTVSIWTIYQKVKGRYGKT